MQLLINTTIFYSKALKNQCISILVAILFLTHFSNAMAQPSDENFEKLLQDIKTAAFPLALANRPIEERNRAKDVQIVFEINYFAREMAFANAKTKKIVISNGFMWSLWAYCQSFLIEGYVGQPHFREWYFHYYLWKHPFYWDGSTVKDPVEFYGLSEDEANKALFNPKLTVNAIFTLAMTEVLLHELGHLAKNAVYSADNSNSFKLSQEIIADRWAYDASNAMGDKSGIGRLVVMGYLHELERFYGFSDKIYNTHPSTQERFRIYVDLWCSLKGELEKKLCGLYSAEYINTFSTDNQLNKYIKRAQNGEAHAAIRLGDFYFEGKIVAKDIKKGCSYYKQAYDEGDINVGALNYAWCLGRGHYDKKDVSTAKSILIDAEARGWKYAKYIREKF